MLFNLAVLPLIAFLGGSAVAAPHDDASLIGTFIYLYTHFELTALLQARGNIGAPSGSNIIITSNTASHDNIEARQPVGNIGAPEGSNIVEGAKTIPRNEPQM
ncbi:hypothetical protein DFH09DRAFT_1080745 [Mycena vulgaris]|nr:hypothetical protein DFH09DRAFT_1080745 [Mycena vulgaris]